MFKYFLVAIILILTACGGMRAAPPHAIPEPAASVSKAMPKAIPEPAASVPKAVHIPEPVPVMSAASKANGKPKLISVRDFLVRGKTASKGFAAYGYLIFSGRPSTADEYARYASICDAYLTKMESISEYATTNPEMFATTFWLLKERIDPGDINCKTIVENYDYARAGEIMAISGIPQSRRGPYVVAWTVPYEQAVINTRPKLVLDLSTLPDEDMNYAIKLWKENVATDPDAWTQGKMNVRVILSAFQDFMKRYSDEILKITSS